MTIKWNQITREEFDIIEQIAKRAVDLANEFDLKVKKSEFVMDLGACHLKCPLDLFRLLCADDANFSHDVFGIRRHINHQDGSLGSCFVPRYASREEALESGMGFVIVGARPNK